MNFVALDFETANADLSSICQIGLVTFKDGEPTETYSMLVDPNDYFGGINISIHGIERLARWHKAGRQKWHRQTCQFSRKRNSQGLRLRFLRK